MGDGAGPADRGEDRYGILRTQLAGGDGELLLPAPYDRVYVLYLCSQIDYYNNETALYGNDKAVYDEAMSEAMAWWRRQHCPDNTGNVQVMG